MDVNLFKHWNECLYEFHFVVGGSYTQPYIYIMYIYIYILKQVLYFSTN